MAAAPDHLASALRDRYRIGRELGRGRFATVYIAQDLRHDRLVAMKVLDPELEVVLGADRVLEEIRTTANLQHPNILPVLDSGIRGGFLYYAYPWREGESLRQRITRLRRLDVEESVEIAIAVAEALDHAHRHGVIHRHIKPENILLQADRALVADFGVALAVRGFGAGRLADPGLAIGSPAYVSPEQVTGDALDGRSDLYSLGCVLFEMLAGKPPFAGDSAQVVLVKRFSADAPALSRIRPSTPQWLSRLVEQLLERSARNRIASAATLLEMLRAGGRLGPAPVLGTRSVAVLPFVDISAEREYEYFCDGITEDLLGRLAGIDELRVPARLGCMRYRRAGLTLSTIAQELGTATVLEGCIRRAGERLRLVAQLTDAATEEPLWAGTYDRGVTDIFAIQSEIAEHIAAALQVRLSAGERTGLETSPTQDFEAYDLYLRGRFHLSSATGGDYRQSVECLEQATSRDPGFAAAWAALSEASFLQGTGYFGQRPQDVAPLFERANARAIELAPDLAATHARRGAYLAWNYFDWAGAHACLNRAIGLDPSCPVARHARAIVFALEGRPGDAYFEMARAIEHDPMSAPLHADAGTFLYLDRWYDAALEHFARLASLDPASPWRALIGMPLVQLGRADDALEAFEAGVELSGAASFFRLLHAYGLAAVGRFDESHAELEELRAREGTEFVWPVGFAYALALMGDTNAALDRLRQGIDERAGWIWINNEPAFDSVRADLRFTRIVGTTAERH